MTDAILTLKSLAAAYALLVEAQANAKAHPGEAAQKYLDRMERNWEAAIKYAVNVGNELRKGE